MGRKPPRHRVHLIHWKPPEADRAVAALRASGFAVTCTAFDPALVGRLADRRPAAVIIDLTRLPSAGRDVGVLLRRAKPTRSLPLVFAGGAPEKIERVRAVLPDAAFAPWDTVGRTLRRVLRAPRVQQAVPDSAFAGYARTPLPKKLGIEAGMHVGLVDPPPDVTSVLGTLPPGTRLARGMRSHPALVLWFVRSRRTLDAKIDRIASALGTGRLWIVWPKRASAVPSDLTQATVRAAGLAHGLVDFKIASIDATWSGLKFVLRSR